MHSLYRRSFIIKNEFYLFLASLAKSYDAKNHTTYSEEKFMQQKHLATHICKKGNKINAPIH